MTPVSSHRLLILTGPSCAGKTPLLTALRRFHPGLLKNARHVILYNDREPRPGETDGVDYHFRPTDRIEALREDDRYLVMKVRSDTQAIDLVELREQLAAGAVVYEGNPDVARLLLTHDQFANIPRLSIFIAPLSMEEIRSLAGDPDVDLPDVVADVMRRKLTRRTLAQQGDLTQADRTDIETRCHAAWQELKLAPLCDHVVPNHDGEDSEHWHAFPQPLGDARLALESVAALLRDDPPPRAENWPDDLLP